jgi:hypothetical protein
MSHYRGGPPFEELWQRRTTIEVEAEKIDLLSLPDLVAAKKTQRDKDWPMIARLVERSYFESEGALAEDRIEFLFRELRSPVAEEENEERRKDREYWQPLKVEREQPRRSARATTGAQP